MDSGYPSWAHPLLAVEEPQDSVVEEKMDKWVREEVQKAYPELPEYNPVERAIRTVLLLLLENEAILDAEDYLDLDLPFVETAEEAVEIADADVNYTMTDEEKQRAEHLLVLMKAGRIKADVNSLIRK